MVKISNYLPSVPFLREGSNIRFCQKDVNMTSGGEGVYRHDVFFSRNIRLKTLSIRNFYKHYDSKY